MKSEPTKIRSSIGSALEYLRESGANVSEADLVVPDVHTLSQRSADFCWVDRNDVPVPPEAGVEFYRVDTAAEADFVAMVLFKKCGNGRNDRGEGFQRLPDGHGFHIRGLQHPDKEIILFRTREMVEACQEAKRRHLRYREGTEERRGNADGATITTRVKGRMSVEL